MRGVRRACVAPGAPERGALAGAVGGARGGHAFKRALLLCKAWAQHEAPKYVGGTPVLGARAPGAVSCAAYRQRKYVSRKRSSGSRSTDAWSDW